MNLKYFLSVILIFTFLRGNSQICVPGIPESFQLKNKAAIVLPFKTLELIDTAKLRTEDFDNGITNRYAIAKEIGIDVKNEGFKTAIAGKGYIWQYRLQSPETYSLGIQFSKFKLPKGASVFIYNDANTQVIGAFTNLNNNPSNQLSIEEFPGNNATIEYFEPSNPEFLGEISIGYVLQSYRDIFTILSTTTDYGINCPDGADWQAQKHAVCRITFVDNLIGYFCSGSLINNAKNDEKPYFLTANHCVSSNVVANTMVFYFNFEAKNCGDTTSIKPLQTLSWASLVATNSTSDFCLTLLSQDIPSSYNAYFAGWDRSGNIPQNGTCIHQPGGRSKCIALDYSSLSSNTQALTWTNENNQVVGTSNINTHWQVEFSVGNVEPGSSGSPLFNENKRIVGQLHGGSTAISYFGKFNLSWHSSAISSQQLATWLDPLNTGIGTLDGIDAKNAPLAEFNTPLVKVCTDTAIQFYDMSQFKPVKWFWSASPSTYEFINSTDSSQNPQIRFLQAGQYSVTLTAINSNGSNSVTHSNCIDAGNINVKFFKYPNDSICGYEFQSYPIIASGASKYTFNIEPSQNFDSITNFDTLKLTLKSQEGPFETYIKVRGEQGNCFAMDSLNFKVVIPVNDNIANSIALGLGKNGPYSNNCATVQPLEPHPATSGCTYIDSWCPDVSDSALHNTIWFSFIGPPDGEITIDTRGFDDRIAVYDALSYSDIIHGNSSLYTIVAANDNRSETDVTAYLENVQVTPGKKYWLQLDGNNGASGNCILDLYSNNIEVYPNPNNGSFNFSIYIEGISEANVDIFTSLGQLVFSKNVMFSIQSSPFTFDIPTISSGFYIIKVNTGYNTYSKKILVIREKNH
jgi:PKD repeat protein